MKMIADNAGIVTMNDAIKLWESMAANIFRDGPKQSRDPLQQ